ncbi:hypothetical protein, partial [Sinorhizobium sp. NFACC03]|uniref:hypothetical protein n=1 Tax=Sinorhizobium sp. NFACC03 TaxID=1566295 RepID=UPI000B836064
RLTDKLALLPSVAEIRYLITRLLLRPPMRTTFVLAWSLWRRKHQAAAMGAHYKMRHELQL